MDDRTAHNLVSQAMERGVNLFDTAPNYTGGRSESLLGKILSGKRDQVVLVSKFGHQPNGSQDYSVDDFWKSLEANLVRLQTDYLDVLLLHNLPAQVYEGRDPIWEALRQARQQGKIRHYGASLDFAVEIESCLKHTDSEVLEVLFNILHQDVRKAFSLIRDKQTGILAKVPLDSGWLTGRFDVKSSFEGVRQRWSPEDNERRAELVSSLRWLVTDGSLLTHKALAYLLAYQEVSCVIPGIRNQKQLQDNLAAAECFVTRKEQRTLEKFWDDFTHNGKDLLSW
jgi:aryl-alcohol dehydrogenase-like predicted oxidoreductase